MWDDLRKVALVGTDKTSLPASGKLAAGKTPEDALLTTAGTLVLRERAGFNVLDVDPAAIDPAAADEKPLCSDRAVSVLRLLILDKSFELMNEWIRLCAESGQRVNPVLIPMLLSYAIGHEDLYAPVRNIVDVRGRWVAHQDNNWRKLYPGKHALGIEDKQWDDELSLADRTALLSKWRTTDPEAAREALEALLKKGVGVGKAHQRIALIGALEVELSTDDEPFLESMLDDRSRKVARAAAKLLNRLPTSRYGERMQNRLKERIVFDPNDKHNPLKVVLDSALTDDLSRDAISIDPPSGMNKNQGWFYNMMVAVPPSLWEAWLEEDAESLLEYAHKSRDASTLIFTGWVEAATTHNEDHWLRAIVSWIISTGLVSKHTGADVYAIARRIPDSDLEAMVTEIITDPDRRARALQGLLLCRHDWSVEFTREALAYLIVMAEDRRMVYQVGSMLRNVVLFCSPLILEEINALFASVMADDSYKYTLHPNFEYFWTTLRRRRDIWEAFGKELTVEEPALSSESPA